MANHHFISYSTVDAQDFAIRLCDTLKAGPPSFSAWLDKRELKPGSHWDEQIVEAIRSCESLLFVMTNDSVRGRSICKNEWTRALKYKKTVIPILLHEDAEVPFQLENRQYIDFTGDFEIALARLRTHLQYLHSPQGQLQSLQDRLRDAEGDLQRSNDPNKQKRIQDDIDALNKRITSQQQVIADPDGTAKRVQENIDSGLERERTPEKKAAGIIKTKFINPPPVIAPTYFQNRFLETKFIGDFIKDNAQRLLTIIGRGGVGKSALVCRLLKSLESGKLPDDAEELKVDGIVYLSEATSKKVNFANIFADLCKLLEPETAKKLESIYKDAKLSTTEKTYTLCRAFPEGRYVVLLDNFEDKTDSETRKIKDEELDEVLRAFLTCEPHSINIIITSRIAPKNLAFIEPSRQFRLDLDEGLEHPYAEDILREMDKDGKVGLKEATNEMLDEARKRTKGYPRALEALFAILSADRDTTLEEVLADAKKLLPDHVVEKLVGEAFSRLDDVAQKVMQALAIIGRPVSNAAIDFILQPYIQGIDSSPVLKRLVDMHFIRKEASRYYLHPVDREYALSRIPEGEKLDKSSKTAVFTQFALLNRGAEFFKLARLPRKDWKNINDLTAQLAEFELRYHAEDYDTAASVLLEIDFDYLMLWGHYRLMTQLHEKLQGKISDSVSKQNSVGILGSAYWSMGQIQQAIACYEKALEYAREKNDQSGEGSWLGGLGICYSELGETRRAIDFVEQALEIARETGDLISEANQLGNLGNRYSDLGETHRAIEFHEQALEINREIGDRLGEAINLGNLGQDYSFLGETQRAIKYYELSIKIAREINSPSIETFILTDIGAIFIDEDKFNKAEENLRRAIQIADDIEYVQLGNVARHYLSLALFYTKDLPNANKLLIKARGCSYPKNNHNIAALQGLVYIYEKDVSRANEAFSTAIGEADAMLQKTESNYTALDCKALSLCGLAICQKSGDYVKEAAQCYTKARSINKDKGYIKRVLRLFDKLLEMDEDGILKGVRSIVAGN